MPAEEGCQETLCLGPLGQAQCPQDCWGGCLLAGQAPFLWSYAGVCGGLLNHLAAPWWVTIVPGAIVSVLRGVTQR